MQQSRAVFQNLGLGKNFGASDEGFGELLKFLGGLFSKEQCF